MTLTIVEDTLRNKGYQKVKISNKRLPQRIKKPLKNRDNEKSIEPEKNAIKWNVQQSMVARNGP